MKSADPNVALTRAVRNNRRVLSRRVAALLNSVRDTEHMSEVQATINELERAYLNAARHEAARAFDELARQRMLRRVVFPNRELGISFVLARFELMDDGSIVSGGDISSDSTLSRRLVVVEKTFSNRGDGIGHRLLCPTDELLGILVKNSVDDEEALPNSSDYDLIVDPSVEDFAKLLHRLRDAPRPVCLCFALGPQREAARNSMLAAEERACRKESGKKTDEERHKQVERTKLSREQYKTTTWPGECEQPSSSHQQHASDQLRLEAKMPEMTANSSPSPAGGESSKKPPPQSARVEHHERTQPSTEDCKRTQMFDIPKAKRDDALMAKETVLIAQAAMYKRLEEAERDERLRLMAGARVGVEGSDHAPRYAITAATDREELSLRAQAEAKMMEEQRRLNRAGNEKRIEARRQADQMDALEVMRKTEESAALSLRDAEIRREEKKLTVQALEESVCPGAQDSQAKAAGRTAPSASEEIDAGQCATDKCQIGLRHDDRTELTHRKHRFVEAKVKSSAVQQGDFELKQQPQLHDAAAGGQAVTDSGDTPYRSRLDEEQASKFRLMEARRRRCQIQEQLHDQEAARQAVAEASRHLAKVEFGRRQPTELFNAEKVKDFNDVQGYETTRALESDGALLVPRPPAPSAVVSQQADAAISERSSRLAQATESQENVTISATSFSDEGRLKLEDLEGHADNEDIATLEPPSWSPPWREKAIQEATPPLWHMDEGRNTQSSAPSLELALENLRERVELLEGKNVSVDEAPNQEFLRDALREVSARLDSRRHLDEKTRSPMLEREIRELLADARRRVDDLEARKRQPLAITEVDGGLDSRADDGSLFFQDECSANVISQADDMVTTSRSGPQSLSVKVQPVLRAAHPSNNPSRQSRGTSDVAECSLHREQIAYKDQNDSKSANGEVQSAEKPNDMVITQRTPSALASSASGDYQITLTQRAPRPGQPTLPTDIESCSGDRRRECRPDSQTVENDAAPLDIAELEIHSEPVVETTKRPASVHTDTPSERAADGSPSNDTSSVGLQTADLIAAPSANAGNFPSQRQSLVRRSVNGSHVSTQTDFDRHGGVTKTFTTHSAHGNALMTTSTTVKMREAGPSKCSKSATTQVQTVALHKLTSRIHAPIGFSSKTIIMRNSTTKSTDPAFVRSTITPASKQDTKVVEAQMDERSAARIEYSRSSGMSRQTWAKSSATADQKGRVTFHEDASKEQRPESPSIRTHIHIRRIGSAKSQVASECSAEARFENEDLATSRRATFKFETVTPKSGSPQPVAAQAGACARIPSSSNCLAPSTREESIYKAKITAGKRDGDNRGGRAPRVLRTVKSGTVPLEIQCESRSGNPSPHRGYSTCHDSAGTIVRNGISSDMSAPPDFDTLDPGTMQMQSGATQESFYPHAVPPQLAATTGSMSRVSTAKGKSSLIHEAHGDALSRAQALYPQVRPEILMASYPSSEKVNKDHEAGVSGIGTEFRVQSAFDYETEEVSPASTEVRNNREDAVPPVARHSQPVRGRQTGRVRPTSDTRLARSRSTHRVSDMSNTAESRSIAAEKVSDGPSSSNWHQTADSAHHATENVLESPANQELPSNLVLLRSPRDEEATSEVRSHPRRDERSEPRCTPDRDSRSRSLPDSYDGRLHDFTQASHRSLPLLGSRSLSPRRTSARMAAVFGDTGRSQLDLLHSPQSCWNQPHLSIGKAPATTDDGGMSSVSPPLNSTSSPYSELSLASRRRLSFSSAAQLSEIPSVDHVAMPALDRQWSTPSGVQDTAQLDSSLQEYDQPLERPADWRQHDELRSVVEREDNLDAREISRTYDERIEYLLKMQQLRRDRLVAAEAAASAREALDTAEELRTLEKEAEERARLRREQAAREAEVRERKHLARERMIREKDKVAAQRAVADALVEIERHKRIQELMMAVRNAIEEARRARVEATHQAIRAAEGERARRMHEFSMQVDAAAVETRTQREASIALARTAFETEQKRAIAAYEGNMARDFLALLAQRAHDTKLAVAYAEAERARRLSEIEASATTSSFEREEASRWVNEVVEIERANRIAQATHCDEHAELERDRNRNKAIELAETERARRMHLLLTEPYMRPWPMSCVCRVDELTRRDIAATHRDSLEQVRGAEVALRGALLRAQKECNLLAARVRDAESLHAEAVDCANTAKRDASLWQQQAFDLMEQIEDVKCATAKEAEMLRTKLVTARAETEKVRRSSEDETALLAELATARAETDKVRRLSEDEIGHLHAELATARADTEKMRRSREDEVGRLYAELATARAETEKVRRSRENKVGGRRAELATTQSAFNGHRDATENGTHGVTVPVQDTLVRTRAHDTERSESSQSEHEHAYDESAMAKEKVVNGAGHLESHQTARSFEECAEEHEISSIGTVASTETGTPRFQPASASESVDTAKVSSHIASARDKREKYFERALTELRTTSDAALAALQNKVVEERRMRIADVAMLKRDFDEAQALLSYERERHSDEERRLQQEIDTVQAVAAETKRVDDIIRTELQLQIELARMTLEDFESRAKTNDTSNYKADVRRLEADLASTRCALERLQNDGQNGINSLRADLANERDQREREVTEGKRHLASAQSVIEALRLQLSLNEPKFSADQSERKSQQIADAGVTHRDAQALARNSSAASLESSGETQGETVLRPADDTMHVFHLNTESESAMQSTEREKANADESVRKLQYALDIAEATSACNDAAKRRETKARSDAENREAELRLELEASRKDLDTAQAKAAHEVASLTSQMESAMQSIEREKKDADESVHKLQSALDIAEATLACNDAAKRQESKARSDAENREVELRLELEASRKDLDAAQAKAEHEVASLTSQIEAQKMLVANMEEKQQDADRNGLTNAPRETDIVSRREHERAASFEEVAGLKAELINEQEISNEQEKLGHDRMTSASLSSKKIAVETEHGAASPFLEKKGLTATVNAAARAVADAERRALVAERQAKQYQDELASALSAHETATRSWHEQTRRHTRELELARDKEALARAKLKEKRFDRDDAVTAELIATKLELASTRMEMDALQQAAARTNKQLAAFSQSQPPKSGFRNAKDVSSKNKRRQ